MNQILLSLLVGLLAGAGGAFAVSFARTETPHPGAGSALQAADLGDLPQRLARIEALLRDRPLSAGPTLAGNPAGGAAAAPTSEAQLNALVDRLEARLRPSIQESVKTSVGEALAERGTSIDLMEETEEIKKKKVTLAELSAELQLSAAEEEDVRRITAESTEGFLKLLVDEGQSVEDVRAEFQSAKSDPAKQAALGIKYMGKIMANIGPMITLGMEHDTKMAQAIGKEKADRLDQEFEVTDLDPMGLKAIFDKDG
jgi:hypothetical protein